MPEHVDVVVDISRALEFSDFLRKVSGEFQISLKKSDSDAGLMYTAKLPSDETIKVHVVVFDNSSSQISPIPSTNAYFLAEVNDRIVGITSATVKILGNLRQSFHRVQVRDRGIGIGTVLESVYQDWASCFATFLGEPFIENLVDQNLKDYETIVEELNGNPDNPILQKLMTAKVQERKRWQQIWGDIANSGGLQIFFPDKKDQIPIDEVEKVQLVKKDNQQLYECAKRIPKKNEIDYYYASLGGLGRCMDLLNYQAHNS
jgi:hypothetical protein